MSKHAGKITSWENLFTMDSQQFRTLGIESARERRYILRWRDKFRRKEYGIGGDLDHVSNGVGELRVVEVPKERTITEVNVRERNHLAAPTATATLSPGMKWTIVNLPRGESASEDMQLSRKKFSQVHICHGNRIKGPYLQAIKGTNGKAAQLAVQEGMWEHKLGRKIDGGERRRAEVQAKKRSEERKKATP